MDAASCGFDPAGVPASPFSAQQSQTILVSGMRRQDLLPGYRLSRHEQDSHRMFTWYRKSTRNLAVFAETAQTGSFKLWEKVLVIYNTVLQSLTNLPYSI